jgi:hypothetical protein
MYHPDIRLKILQKINKTALNAFIQESSRSFPENNPKALQPGPSCMINEQYPLY